MNDYDTRNKVIAKISEAFEEFKHHSKLTVRAKTILEKHLPYYSVYVDGNGSYPFTGRAEISVWGNSGELGGLGYIPYNNRLCLSWYSDRGVSQTWQEGLTKELDRWNALDYAEREEDEKKLIPYLEKLEQRVRKARLEAQELIAALPVPKSATLRRNSVYWKSPSANLCKLYPYLFGG